MNRVIKKNDWPNRVVYLAVLVLLTTTSLYAKNEIELEGLIIDRTMTLKGRQFYQKFSSVWNPSKRINTYNLTIKEIPSAAWGSRITIENQGKALYSIILQRNGRDLKNQVQLAISVVNKQLFSIDLLNHLDSDDMSANGY